MSKWRKAKLIIGGLFGLSTLAMARAAMTAYTDKGIRSDGTKAPRPDQQDVQGDPKGGAPPYHEESATPDAEGGRSSDPEDRTTDPAAEAAEHEGSDSPKDAATATD